MSTSNWLLKRKKELKLECHELINIQSWMPGWHDIYARLEFEGKSFSGRAQDKNKNVALEKACSELIERIAVENSDSFTSSGFSAHPDLRQATIRARNELVERDIFLCNFLTSSSLYPVQNSIGKTAQSTIFNQLQHKLSKMRIELKLSVLKSDFKLITVVCAAFGMQHEPQFGVSIGLGTSSDLESAITKATLECFISILEILCEFDFKTISKKRFLRLKYPEIEHHRMLGLDRKVGEDFYRLFQTAPAPLTELKAVKRSLATIKSEIINLPEFFESCPVYIVRAHDPSMQALFFGSDTKKNVNVPRLKQFLKNMKMAELSIDFEKLHFFG